MFYMHRQQLIAQKKETVQKRVENNSIVCDLFIFFVKYDKQIKIIFVSLRH